MHCDLALFAAVKKKMNAEVEPGGRVGNTSKRRDIMNASSVIIRSIFACIGVAPLQLFTPQAKIMPVVLTFLKTILVGENHIIVRKECPKL